MIEEVYFPFNMPAALELVQPRLGPPTEAERAVARSVFHGHVEKVAYTLFETRHVRGMRDPHTAAVIARTSPDELARRDWMIAESLVATQGPTQAKALVDARWNALTGTQVAPELAEAA